MAIAGVDGKTAAAVVGGAAALACLAKREAAAADVRLVAMLMRDGASRVFVPSKSDGTSELSLWRRLKRVWELACVLRIERQHQREVRKLPHNDGDWGKVFCQESLAHVRHLQSLKKEKPPDPEVLLRAVQETPIIKDLVLVGGGHSHVHVLRMLGMEPMPGVRVTLITRDVETPYSGMLPGHIAGFYTRRECHIDLNKVGRFARVRLVHGTVKGIDRDRKMVLLEGDRPPISYDVVSINIGSAPRVVGDAAPRVGAGATAARAAEITPVKPIDSFGKRWDDLLERAVKWEGAHKVVVVGGGAGGVELAFAIRARLKNKLQSAGDRAVVEVSLLTRGSLLPSHTPGVRAITARMLQERSIAFYGGCDVVTAEKGTITCRDGRSFHYDECIWCTQGAPQPWVAECGLEVDAGGFLVVDQQMRCFGGDDHIFAAGDIATIRGHPRPKAGVFAVMAGMPLWLNLQATLSGKRLVPYFPQASFLGLLGTGDGGCIASRGDLATEGKYLWGLKDWIDRKWMYEYTDGLPEMVPPKPTAPPAVVSAGEDAVDLLLRATMRCGGCGAKVGASALSSALARLDIPQQPRDMSARVVLGTGDDAAVVDLQAKGGGTVSSVQTIDFFRSFVNDPYVFGRIAAVHALSDCEAMGAVPQTAMALAQLPYAMEEKTVDDIVQMMAGANASLRAAGCALVGGHTCEAKEMGLGFAVTGVLPGGSRAALRKDALKAGDALILTKPIGTGALMAADMRVKARGPWVMAALDSMATSNGPPASVLRKHGALACTDITGFGLVGHMLEMVKGSNVAASITIADLPLYDGAAQAVVQGIFSSLQPANTRLRRAVINHNTASKHPLYPLLFDPQTSGGLLAGVPAHSAEACVAELRSSGVAPFAAVIGKVTGPASADAAVDGFISVDV